MTTREEQAVRSKQKLLDALHKLLQTKEYDNISISDIAVACGMSTGNFYHYFSSKEELFTELERKPYFQMLIDLDSIRSWPVSEQLRYYISNWVNLMADCYGVNITRHWISHHVKPLAGQNSGDNKINIIANEILPCLEHGVKSGELAADTPVKDIAYSIAFTLFGVAGYYSMTEGSFSVRNWADSYGDMLDSSVLAAHRCTPDR